MPVDAGDHATPDQIRAAEKRQAALEAAGGRSSEPEERHAPEPETAAPKSRRSAKKA